MSEESDMDEIVEDDFEDDLDEDLDDDTNGQVSEDNFIMCLSRYLSILQ